MALLCSRRSSWTPSVWTWEVLHLLRINRQSNCPSLLCVFTMLSSCNYMRPQCPAISLHVRHKKHLLIGQIDKIVILYPFFLLGKRRKKWDKSDGAGRVNECSHELIRPFCPCSKIRQSSIWYTGLLGRLEERIIDQASDVPSIIYFFTISHRLRALKTLYFQKL